LIKSGIEPLHFSSIEILEAIKQKGNTEKSPLKIFTILPHTLN